jgi:hypothetical protein
MTLFSTLFTVPNDDVSGNTQLEITDMQWNGGFKEKKLGSLISIPNIDMNTLPEIQSHALQMVSLFGNT